MSRPRTYFDRKGKGLLDRLHASGIAPPLCREATLYFPCDGTLEIVYRCYLTDDALEILGKDFLSAALRAEEYRDSDAKQRGEQ